MARRFLRLRRSSPTETALRAHRARPSKGLEDRLTRLAQPRPARLRSLRPAASVAGVIALMLAVSSGALAAAGGGGALSATVDAISSLVPDVSTNSADKVTICHATGSDTNPFVKISPSAAGVFNGHLATSNGGNAGADHQGAEDIIPPFEYQGTTYSQNWDAAGMAIFEAKCKVNPQYDNPLS
jgi:hypothetical protein